MLVDRKPKGKENFNWKEEKVNCNTFVIPL